MTAKTVQQAPSHTALGAAFYRASAHRDATVKGIGSDHLAWIFLSRAHRFLVRFGWIRRAILRKSARLTPGVYEYVLARTAFFDERYARALDDGTEQIVLLGAGYDTRPYRMPSPAGLKVIELDIAPTQERKRDCLNRAGIAEPAGLVFAPIDFNSQSIAGVLHEAGYDPGRKTVFLWEGVTYYLNGDAVDDVLRLVKDNIHPETTIAFDYAITVSDENIDRIYGARAFLETWRKRRKDEPIRFLIDQGALNSFLGERGLDLALHLDTSDMENAYSMGKVTGFFRLAVASPTADWHEAATRGRAAASPE
jgi:methyltransferase (TIGR00027 family)